MLVVGVTTQCLDPVLTAAACMSSRDPFITPTGMRDEAQKARRRFCETSDHLAVLRAYAEWRQARPPTSTPSVTVVHARPILLPGLTTRSLTCT